MSKQLSVLIVWLVACLGAPMLGAISIDSWRVVPESFPRTAHTFEHAPASSVVFAILLLAEVASVYAAWNTSGVSWRYASVQSRRFGRAGACGLLLLGASWIVAWSSPVALLRDHTFIGLWLGYILFANALLAKITGRALFSLNRTTLKLFVASSSFWWFFEFENMFFQNWRYQGADHFSTPRYVLHASLAFSTVLPAVFITAALIEQFIVQKDRSKLVALRLPNRFAAGLITAIVGVLPLVLAPIFPDQLFPALWISPLIVLVYLQRYANLATIFDGVARGDVREPLSWALGALICGALWELWNYHSFPKWSYSIPYVEYLYVFEMPLLGYAGYAPFGLLCGSVVRLLGESLPRAESELSKTA
jgi:hypothetical protein